MENVLATRVTISSLGAARDLTSFLGRARRVWDGSARLVAGDGHLQVYVGILMPRGLLDRTPTVLGLRVASISGEESFDVVVPLESLIHRIESAIEDSTESVTVDLPTSSPSLQWPAISPPRDGWKRRMGVTTSQLADVARRGIQAISEAIPESVGESVLQKVRSEVWGQPMAHKKSIPWAAGFAADALGLLGQRSLAVHTAGYWVRLSSFHGYVLIKGQQEPEGLGEPED